MTKKKTSTLPTVRRVKLADIQLDKNNANRHTKRGGDLVGGSLKKLGAGRSILLDKDEEVIAGELTLKKAIEAGFEDLLLIPSDGKTLVAVQRTDMDLDDPKTGAREMAYVDNRAHDFSSIDPSQIAVDLENGMDLSGLWTNAELEAKLGKVDLSVEIRVEEEQAQAIITQYKLEVVSIEDLREHPRNYREHPDDQIEHLAESIREHGFYRNIVVAKDGTILAGHGVVKALISLGLKYVPVFRLDMDPNDPRALKVLTGDNEIAHLNEIDDRALSEILKEINETDVDGLIGTGFDEMMLANLVFVTRPQSEIENFDEAAEWAGLPEYEPMEEPIKVTVSFRNMEDRAKFAKRLELIFTEKTRSCWYPARPYDDTRSVKWEGEGESSGQEG